MPEGIMPFVLGGGDCRRLPWGSNVIPLCMSLITCGSSVPVGVEGLRLCLVRYEDEPADLGRVGRVSVAGNTKSEAALWLIYDGDRLGAGVDCFEVAGESCEGGV